MTKLDTAIFGIGGTSLTTASSAYSRWLKAKKIARPRLLYLANPATYKPAEKPRLILVENVSTLHGVIKHLHPKDRVLVSDSPVLLSEVPNIQVLDIEPSETHLWSYRLKPFNPQRFHTLLTKSQKADLDITQTAWERLDQLGLVIDDTSAGNLVTPIKAITAQLDHATRVKFRQEIASWALGNAEPALIDSFLTRRFSDPLGSKLRADLIAALTKYQTVVRGVVAALQTKKSIKRLIDSSDLTVFEAKFIYKMVVK